MQALATVCNSIPISSWHITRITLLESSNLAYNSDQLVGVVIFSQ